MIPRIRGATEGDVSSLDFLHPGPMKRILPGGI